MGISQCVQKSFDVFLDLAGWLLFVCFDILVISVDNKTGLISKCSDVLKQNTLRYLKLSFNSG